MSDQLSLFLVNATFVFLVGASALTWAIVIVKALQQRRLNRQTNAFLDAYAKLPAVPPEGELSKHAGPTARVAQVGAESWHDSAKSRDLEVRTDLLERSLRQQVLRERKGVEAGLPVLASVGSTSPFVGLFGTVLGIIHALSSISSSGSASLDVVAGPIGEALVATAVGIAVAVPAVLAYNYFVRRLKTLSADLEDFANDFVSGAIRTSFPRATRNHDDARQLEATLELRQEASA